LTQLNNSLRILSFSGNDIGGAKKFTFEDYLSKNKTIQELCLEKCNLDEEDFL